MNKTWPLLQPIQGVRIKSGAECLDCERVVPPHDSPEYKRNYSRYADPSKAAEIICRRCQKYEKIMGKRRPARLEEQRQRRAPQTKPNPGQCEYPDRPRTVGFQWMSAQHKFYCSTHRSRTWASLWATMFSPNHRRNSGRLDQIQAHAKSTAVRIRKGSHGLVDTRNGTA